VSVKELNRIETIHRVLEKEITQKKAADILDLSDRQIRRIVKRVGEEGNKGFIHKSRGRHGHRAIPEDVKAKVLELYQERYKGFGPTLTTEKLYEIDGISLSRESLRKWLIKGGISYKRRKHRPHKEWRERKQYYGEMVQMDGSEHDWLEGRGPKLTLMGYIDDATGKVFARFYTYEGTIPAMDSFKRYIKAYGIPVSVYLDKHTTYKSNAKPTEEDALCKSKPLSEFERALGELGVRVIHANSPQAKGRIERLFGTLQDRLVKELRLKGVNTLEDANRRLQCYLPIYNKKFSIKAAMTADLHRSIPEDMELDRVLCIKAKRVLRNDFTISYNGKLYQIEDNIRARDVIVEERIGDSMLITHKDRLLKYKEINKPRIEMVRGRPTKAKVGDPPSFGREGTKPYVLTVRKNYKPSADHPWRRFKLNEDIHNINNYPQKEKGSQKEKKRLLII
jgi:transposase